MTLKDLGYNEEIEEYRKEHHLDAFDVGRVVSEHKERYRVRTAESEFDAEIIGNLRFSAVGRSDFPAVGDWVAISEFDDGKALIHHVFPRRTVIERQAVGRQGEKQIIAANVDYAFIVQAVDRDFNINRMERYLAICASANVSPVILLSKTDLIEDGRLSEITAGVRERIQEIPVIGISNESLRGIGELRKKMKSGATYCLLGSSGVGKSSLLNNLSEQKLMKTIEISSSTGKGRHATTHRELIVLPDGGILIDNPGMREVGIADSTTGLEMTFDTISELAAECRFNDCTHTTEIGCAVLEALEEGRIDQDTYENYLKLEREKAFFESTVAQRRRKDKEFGKMVRSIKKSKKDKKP